MWTSLVLLGLGAPFASRPAPPAAEPSRPAVVAPADRTGFARYARWQARMFGHDVLGSAVVGGGVTHAASSVQKDAGDATALVDGKRTTWWQAKGTPTEERPEWVEFRFPEPIGFDTIVLQEPEVGAGGSHIERFRIAAEVDGELRTVASAGAAGGRTVARTSAEAGLVRTRRVRLIVESATDPPRLARLALYATPPTVRIEPRDVMSLNPVTVRMTSRVGATIRYTLDGTPVTEASRLYEGPFSVERAATVRARAFDAGGPGLELATARVHVVADDEWKRGSEFVRAPESGLRVQVFEGTLASVQDLASRQPIARKDVAGFDASAHRTRAEHVALRYSGFVQVPQDGLFTFALVSDDGSRLSIHGDVVVDNDGLHAARRDSGRVALRKGWHPIQVEWFNVRGPGELEVRWSGPGVGRDELIPKSALSR